MSALKNWYKLYVMTFLEIYNAIFGSRASVLRFIYLINLTGQKQYVTELKWILLVIMSEDSPVTGNYFELWGGCSLDEVAHGASTVITS